jgi:Fe-S oxidoreductase
MGILSIFKGKGNTLYYPGCLSKFVLKPETENYKKILGKIGIDFLMLPDEMCCGSPVLNAGYEKEARKLARKNLELFKSHDIRRIITNCPACFKTFREYKEMLPDWDIEVEHITTVILEYLRKKKFEYKQNYRVAYHDPCHLGRHSGIYDEPREILRRIGFEVVELKNSRENALCCGGGAGLKANNPELANKIAKERIKQAADVGVDKIITTCPLCFSHLEENADIDVEEFSYAVADALALKPQKTCSKEIKKDEKIVEACS